MATSVRSATTWRINCGGLQNRGGGMLCSCKLCYVLWQNLNLKLFMAWTFRRCLNTLIDGYGRKKHYVTKISCLFFTYLCYRLHEQTIEQFFKLNLPMRLPQLKGLINGFDSALQHYTSKVVAQLGSLSFVAVLFLQTGDLSFHVLHHVIRGFCVSSLIWKCLVQLSRMWPHSCVLYTCLYRW